MPISKYDINRSIRSQISKFSARWNLGLSNYDACHVTEGKNFLLRADSVLPSIP